MYRLIGLFVLLFFGSCQNKDAVMISGTVHNAGNIKVVAFYEGDNKLDSLFIGDGGKFKFERKSTQPRLLTIEIGKNKYPVVAELGEQLVLDTDLQDPDNYRVEGSPLSVSLKSFKPFLVQKKAFEDSLQNEFAELINNKTPNEIEEIKFQFLTKLKDGSKRFINAAVNFANNNPNLAGFYAMSTLDPDFAETELVTYYDKIQDQFLNYRAVNDFKEKIAKLKKLAVGQQAPSFQLFTPENKAVDLNQYRGKITLVDFWASWCMPCRKENPNLVKIYNEFQSQNFTILGVSLDNNPGSWLRAIKDDQLPWTQVSDLQAWNSEIVKSYQLKSIPSSFLLDEDGVIMAKNLSSKELEVFLTQYLQKQ